MAESNGVPDARLPLIPLQSKDHEEILDVIDQLRLEGISRYVDLPQLIVCGDQSSGKSSVLEAISGLGFPTKDNLCTRFATELILRRSTDSGVTASIQPDNDRPEAEQEKLRAFKSPTVALSDFRDIVASAERLIGAGTDQLQFTKDVLRVEVSGPTQPHLTLVDLPGLYHAPDESQGEAGVAFVESLVLSYIRSHRSVILAVVSAKSDIALQKVTAFTRKVDEAGARTLGVITKPDTLIPTSDMEKSFIDLAKNRNKRVHFRLGWHVLKNRDHDERHLSLDERRDAEMDFLRKGVWVALDSAQIGIDALRPRLSLVLKDHIVRQLPSFIADTQEAFVDTDASLKRMGDARKTVAEQKRYLFNASEKFTVLLGHAIDGTYLDVLFGDAMTDEGYHRRLRAVIQNELAEFAEILWAHGEKWQIINDDESDDENERAIKHSDFVDEVLKRMRRSRGRELLGMFNPLVVGDLFYLQAQPWAKLVTSCIETVLESVQRAVHLLIEDILDERTAQGVLAKIINPELAQLETALRYKTYELLAPQQAGHPITYNHYFTETVQQTREQHLRKHITQQLESFFGSRYADSAMQKNYTFSMSELIDSLSSQNEANMEIFACSEAIDYMQAYYKVREVPPSRCISILTVHRWLEKSSLTTSVIWQSRDVSCSQ